MCICGGAMLKCSFGGAPSCLNIMPVNRVISDLPVANIMDNKPFVNIIPFAVCSSPANPSVASATAAAMGVVTPMPCIPLTAAPWVTGRPDILIGGYPALDASSKLICAYGGVIEITWPGKANIQY